MKVFLRNPVTWSVEEGLVGPGFNDQTLKNKSVTLEVELKTGEAKDLVHQNVEVYAQMYLSPFPTSVLKFLEDRYPTLVNTVRPNRIPKPTAFLVYGNRIQGGRRS